MTRAAKASERNSDDKQQASRSRQQPNKSSLQDRFCFGNRQTLAFLQRRTNVAASTPAVQAIADHGLLGAAQPLPFRERIQASFGRHDVSGIEAHTDVAAREAGTR
jgi:hypothetical protein